MSPPAPNFRIRHLVAVVAVDPKDHSEGLCGVYRDGAWYPLIAADEARLESFRQLLPELRRVHKGVIRLVRFSVREDVETFEPGVGGSQ